MIETAKTCKCSDVPIGVSHPFEANQTVSSAFYPGKGLYWLIDEGCLTGVPASPWAGQTDQASLRRPLVERHILQSSDSMFS